MKFIFLVEGATEQKAIPSFLKRWLDPKLDQKVGIQMDKSNGWPELVRDIPQKVPMYLRGPGAEKVIAVIALLDLYGPTIYPAHLITAKERSDWASNHLENKVGDEHFRVYFAVHETEAWLLSQPELFPDVVSKKFPGHVHMPETINFNEPPSKLLNKLYLEKLKRKYKKVSQGKELFEKLDPQVAYEKCPNFAHMMDGLLLMAKEAGL